MLYLLLAGFIASFAAPFLYRQLKSVFSWIAPLLPLALFFGFARFYPLVVTGEHYREYLSWVPSLGIRLSFLLDALSLVFVLIITGVGSAVFLYAGTYMKEYEHSGRFFGYIGMFMTSMLGLVLSDNLVSLFVFWELTSVTSFLLIGFSHHKESSRTSAIQALLVTGGGGLALFGGLILLGGIAGTFEFSEMLARRDLLQASPLYPAVVLLVMLGAFTKSAQFPFHFWLPNAMAAPTPVSAYLHSATMVKAGVYLLARMTPVLGGTDLWQGGILLAGTLTMVFSALLAFNQTDLKKLLAYSTLSVLGSLCMMIAIGTELAIKAFFLYLVAHSLYKATLFLVAGTIDHATGTRDVTRLGGLRRAMPVTMLTAFFASFSMVGLIPFLGFIGKETFYESVLAADPAGYLIAAAVVANGFLVMVTILAGFRPFLGRLRDFSHTPHEAPFQMLLGPGLLALGGLVAGLFPVFFLGSLLDRFVSDLLAGSFTFHLKLWHGFNRELMLSLLTLLLGGLFYAIRLKTFSLVANRTIPSFLKPSWWYDRVFDALMKTARIQTRILQNGSLRSHITVIVVTVLAVVGMTIALTGSPVVSEHVLQVGDVTFYEVALVVMILSSTLLLLTSSLRLKSVVSLGVLGFSIGMIFILYGAPDLALTTFAIETLSVILFVLVLYKLPPFVSSAKTAGNLRDALVAAGLGGTMSLMVLLAVSGELSSDLKRYFAEASLAEGGGRNIVNVILVDFRAIDTLGEITVLAVAAIGVFALMKLAIGQEKQ